MQRQHAIVLATMVIVIVMPVAWLTISRHGRQREFAEAQRLVASQGGSLSFDLVDGNYMLDLSGDTATDKTIRSLLPILTALPTGFTLIGPGEGRLFWVTLTDGSITDDGLAALSTLRISWLQISGAHVTDTSVSTLVAMDELYGIILSDVRITDDGITKLRSAKAGATIVINGESEMPNNQALNASGRQRGSRNQSQTRPPR